ncbi:MAG: hypothetical protein ABIQ88_00170 [Chitinophagaceae bacterium]
MKEISSEILAQLHSCRQEREHAANELQNEVNQLLASVLLWIRFAKTENRLSEDQSVRNAENNLQEAIERVRALHYSLSKEM